MPERRHTVVVTGGAGFVGGHFVHHLVRQGLDVAVIDDLSSGTLDNLPQKVVAHAFTRGDVCSRPILTDHVRRASHLIHFASIVGIKRVIQDPEAAIRTNVHAVSMISELCAAERVPFTYVSSSAVYQYGSPLAKTSCEENSVTYSQGRHPASIYGTSKALGELICENNRRLHGLRCLIVRPFNLIGTRQSAAYGMVVPTFVRRALERLPLQIHGNGSQVRCFSDVRQAVELLWMAITRTDWKGRVINLATDDNVTSILQLARLVQKVVGHSCRWDFVPHQSAYGENFADVDYRRPSLGSLQKLVGTWRHISLEETLREIVAFELVKLQLRGANLITRTETEAEPESMPSA